MQLRQPAHRVDPRAIRYWAAQGVMSGVILLAAAIALWATGTLGGPWRWIALAVAVLVLVVGAAVIPVWRYRVHRWEVTDTAVYTQRGWLNQERRIAPLNRVQTVDLERGPVEALFRLATVTVTTASARGALKIEGLDRAVAADLADRLTAATSAGTDDAT